MSIQEPQLCLKCGKFLSLGSPNVSVFWRDPAGHQLPSSTYVDGFFYLDLPSRPEGGNYTCSIDQGAKAARCIQPESATSATYYLETTETALARQAEDLQDLESELKEMRKNSDYQESVDSNTQDIQKLRGKLGSVEVKNKNLMVEFGNLTHKLHDLEQADITHQEENNKLQEHLTLLDGKVDDKLTNWKDEIQQNLTGLLQTTRKIQDDQTTMKQSLEELQASDSQLKGNATELHKRMEAAQEREKNLTSHQQLLSNVVEELHITLNESSAQIARDLESERDLLEDKLLDVTLAMNRTLERLASLEHKQNTLETENQNLKNELQQLQQRQTQPGNHQTLEKRISSLENLRVMNVAASKTAFQSSDYHDVPASRALDNNRNADWAGKSCSHTSVEDNSPWWMVDLGKAFNVFAVVITNRGDCCWDRLINFYVEVFEEDPRQQHITAQVCYHHAAAMAKGATETLYCWKPARGRFVRIRKSTSIIHVCEVEVLALVPGDEQ